MIAWISAFNVALFAATIWLMSYTRRMLDELNARLDRHLDDYAKEIDREAALRAHHTVEQTTREVKR